MDFFNIKTKKSPKEKHTIIIYPDFKVCRSTDLMVKGKSFYAIWNPETKLWSTDEYDVQKLVDKELVSYAENMSDYDGNIVINKMSDFSTNSWKDFRKYMQNISDNAKQLDEKMTFLNDETEKKDYVSRKLDYPLEDGDTSAYDELIGTLYDQEEKDKIEWAIGAVISGDAKTIQKFLVLYGEAGAGKSTVLNIIQKLFKGYYTTFEAKELVSNNNSFSTEAFRNNPLVAIQHDGDLSKIEDNTKLNSIVSHEEMVINEKYKSTYTNKINCFLFMATNKPVKITDAKSGIIRRLIDVKPSGKRFPSKKYQTLYSQIDFELGAIAKKCLEKYRSMGKNYYNNYRPIEMMYNTDVFFNFVESCFDQFNTENGISLKAAYAMYKDYCDETGIDKKLPMYKFREELKNYFKSFDEVAVIDNERIRSYYRGFIKKKFDRKTKYELENEDHENNLVLDCKKSLLDDILKDCKAQYANDEGTPTYKWDNCKTTLSEINTKELHYVKIPENHIVIDFDIKDDKGNKSLEKNLEAASKFPPTYAEFSKSKCGIHLHYIYDGDVSKLSRLYDDNIEVKVFTGNSSLRRKLSLCNDIPIAHIKSGLPLKKEKKMINFDAVKNEKGLRQLIERNLNKEIHPGTKPSVDFIYKILEDAYNSKMPYDVIDMRNRILAFANNSTHHSEYCVRLVANMKFSSEQPSSNIENYRKNDIVFFDVEVFPNVNIVCFKKKNKPCSTFINPNPTQIGELLNFKLVGFNCRRYDNHILYSILIGKTPEEVFNISQGIINNNRTCFFGNAWNISYADIYDFSSKKQSLKKFEIELGLHHKENNYPWDKPLPKDKWDEVADYCCNDVIATEAVFEDRKEDFVARQILSDISGLSVNDTTQNHTAKIIFGDDPNPQEQFIYTDLSTTFPGYTFDAGVSSYMGEDPSEGGYVYAEPGMYNNVALLDVASLHPTSLIELNLFGDKYTKNFKQLLDARLAIKHKDYDKAKKMLNGALAKYLGDDEESKKLAYALKIVINSVYGYTSAKFENKFRDNRNVDNIVAKRGSLFMISLKNEVQKKGYTVAHIKTDSIKIPNADSKIIKFVMDYGKKYGYTFEHEATYDRMCLVNDAVYIAKYSNGEKHDFELPTGEKINTEWTATGTEFQVPYVFKTLFSKTKINFRDLCETKSVTSSLYLDFNENLKEDEHNYHFVGKVGLFCPMVDGINAGILLREKDGKYYAAVGTKGYRWMESEVVKELKLEDKINKEYYITLVNNAIKDISQFGDFEQFAN